jgi:hypothetical protein
MTFGTVGMRYPSLAAMVDAIRAPITREALHQRFTAPAVSFMQRCVYFVLNQRIKTIRELRSEFLNHFKSIKIFDSSSWGINPILRDVLPGSGGGASAANCKVQLCYEYLRGALSFFEVTPGNASDRGYASNVAAHIRPAELFIADLGYFCLNSLSQIVRSGAFFVFRFLIGTALFDPETMRPIDLQRILRKALDNIYQMDVLMGSKEQTRIRCRLICMRVDEETAKKRRMTLRNNARRKGRNVSQLNLFMAGWILMVTNVPSEWLPPEMVRPLYSIRWQIELLFKQLKSVLTIDRSVTGNIHRLYCEVLGKMIAAILFHRIHADLNQTLWNTQQGEISMEKLYKRLQERSFIILNMLLTSVSRACKFMADEFLVMVKNCRKLYQKSRPTTLQVIDQKILRFKSPVIVLNLRGLT